MALAAKAQQDSLPSCPHSGTPRRPFTNSWRKTCMALTTSLASAAIIGDSKGSTEKNFLSDPRLDWQCGAHNNFWCDLNAIWPKGPSFIPRVGGGRDLTTRPLYLTVTQESLHRHGAPIAGRVASGVASRPGPIWASLALNSACARQKDSTTSAKDMDSAPDAAECARPAVGLPPKD